MRKNKRFEEAKFHIPVPEDFRKEKKQKPESIQGTYVQEISDDLLQGMSETDTTELLNEEDPILLSPTEGPLVTSCSSTPVIASSTQLPSSFSLPAPLSSVEEDKPLESSLSTEQVSMLEQDGFTKRGLQYIQSIINQRNNEIKSGVFKRILPVFAELCQIPEPKKGPKQIAMYLVLHAINAKKKSSEEGLLRKIRKKFQAIKEQKLHEEMAFNDSMEIVRMACGFLNDIIINPKNKFIQNYVDRLEHMESKNQTFVRNGHRSLILTKDIDNKDIVFDESLKEHKKPLPTGFQCIKSMLVQLDATKGRDLSKKLTPAVNAMAELLNIKSIHNEKSIIYLILIAGIKYNYKTEEEGISPEKLKKNLQDRVMAKFKEIKLQEFHEAIAFRTKAIQGVSKKLFKITKNDEIKEYIALLEYMEKQEPPQEFIFDSGKRHEGAFRSLILTKDYKNNDINFKFKKKPSCKEKTLIPSPVVSLPPTSQFSSLSLPSTQPASPPIEFAEGSESEFLDTLVLPSPLMPIIESPESLDESTPPVLTTPVLPSPTERPLTASLVSSYALFPPQSKSPMIPAYPVEQGQSVRPQISSSSNRHSFLAQRKDSSSASICLERARFGRRQDT
jgi:hypothetical protein